MDEAIIVKDLFVSYQGNQVVQNVSFDIEKGKLVGIIGPNGAGKSTLMKAVLDLIPSDKGFVQVLREDIRSARKHVAYVPQRSDIDWDFPITVLDVVLIGTYPSLGMMKRPKKEHRDWAFECLKKVGMEEFKNRQIGELSGGQQQRAAAARAIIHEPTLILADEPTGNLDSKSAKSLMGALQDLHEQKKVTIAMVTHDPVAASYCERILFIRDGEIFSEIHKGRTKQAFFQEILDVLAMLGGEYHELSPARA